MKIGILTYHRAHNYGALLQAYALKNYLLSLGHDVEIVDYWPHYHNEMYKLWSWRIFWKISSGSKYHMLKRMLLLGSRRQKRRQAFLEFIEKYMSSVPIPSEQHPFDVVIYGSDQIWREQNLTPLYKGFNDVYFGNDLIPARKRITYSASMGSINDNEKNRNYLKQALQRFDAISVREKDLEEFIQPLAPLPVHLTLDPVFLLTSEQWEKIMDPLYEKSKYLVYYNLQPNKRNEEVVAYLKDKYNLSVIQITGAVSKDEYSLIGPSRFLSLIKNAEFIVSSSFHGVAFSILMRKEFFAYLEKNAQRVVSLLESLGLEDRYITDSSLLPNLKSIDYEMVDERLADLKKSSVEYLQNNLSGE